MKKLTKLDRHIKAAALMAIRKIGEIKGDQQTGIGIVIFSCDGVYDELVYDFEKRKFTEIRYKKCIGKVTTTPFSPPLTGYSDRVKIITIPL